MKFEELGPASQAEVKLAMKWGFKPMADQRRGKGWFKFFNGQRIVWSSPPHWISGDVVNSITVNQIKHPQLADALRHPIPEVPGGTDKA